MSGSTAVVALRMRLAHFDKLIWNSRVAAMEAVF